MPTEKKRRKYRIHFSTTVEIEVDDAVIDAIDDEWRRTYFKLKTPTEIAEHIAYNMHINNCNLSEIDGFADRKDEEAAITDEGDWDIEGEILK